jgi:hypothetical protein
MVHRFPSTYTHEGSFMTFTFQIKDDEMGGACSMHGNMRNAYILVGKPERKIPLRTCRH